MGSVSHDDAAAGFLTDNGDPRPPGPCIRAIEDSMMSRAFAGTVPVASRRSYPLKEARP